MTKSIREQFLAIACCAGLSGGCLQAADPAAPGPRIYFIGNSVTDTVRDLTNETRDYFEKLLHEVRAQTPFLKHPPLLVPVGYVLADLHTQMKAGKVPGWTNVYQLYKDGIHLNQPGSYAVACAFFATLFKQSPEGLPTEPYGRIPPELAKTIQQAAWAVVQAHPDAGVSVSKQKVPTAVDGGTPSHPTERGQPQ
jgi:hypothetical protein